MRRAIHSVLMHKSGYLVPLLLVVILMGLGMGTVSAEEPPVQAPPAPVVESASPADEMGLEQPKGPYLDEGVTNDPMACDRWTRGYWAFSCQLSYGDRNNQVRAIQLILNCTGINSGPVDGIFGSQTREAVRISQALGGRTRTGIVDAPTWRDYETRLVLSYHDDYMVHYKVKGCEPFGELFMKSRPTGRWYVKYGNGYVPMSRDYWAGG